MSDDLILIKEIHDDVRYIRGQQDRNMDIHEQFTIHLGTIAGAVSEVKGVIAWAMKSLVASFGIMVAAIVAIAILAMVSISKVEFFASRESITMRPMEIPSPK